MTPYATLDFAKTKMKAAQPTTTQQSVDDMDVLDDLRSMSLQLDSEFPQVPRWPLFAPWVGTRKFRVTPERVRSSQNTFQWTEYLLELTGDITLGTQTLVVGTDVELWPDSTQPPFHMLRLLDWTRSWYADCTGCAAPLQVSIPGIWGFHRDWANAWPQITTLNGALNNSQTSVTFTSVNAPDPYGMTPGISAGNLIQFDDDSGEYCEVISTNPQANTAVLLRGVNGTSALKSAHLNGVGVLVFQVEQPVRYAVARQAGLMYSRNGVYITVEVQGMSEIRYPSTWLADVRSMMQGYSLGY